MSRNEHTQLRTHSLTIFHIYSITYRLKELPEHLGSPSVISQYCVKSHCPLAERANIATLPSANATMQREEHDTMDRIASCSFTLK